jgi:hypothetical protein
VKTTTAPHLELRTALRSVQQTGAAFIENALPGELCSRIAEEAATATFERLPEHEGQVHQDGELFVLTAGLGAYPEIKDLRDELTHAVRRDGTDIAGLSDWAPGEVSIQRYRTGTTGITPHRDLKRYRTLVAVFTIEGNATFTLCANRTGEPLAQWPTRTGSLVLLRAPGLGGIEDGRPLHAVTGPIAGQRISVGFRAAPQPHAA